MMMAATTWSERMLELLHRLNNLQRGGCLPFCVQGQRVGWVRQSVAQLLSQKSDVFALRGEASGRLELNDGLRSPQERTRAVQEVMEDLRNQNAFPCLREWRNEALHPSGEIAVIMLTVGKLTLRLQRHLVDGGRIAVLDHRKQYDVKAAFSDPPLLTMERAAAPLLGIPRYGVHVNGFLRRGGEIFMWIGRRSQTKPTYPGRLDHLAAGGISAGSGVWETLLKECGEEACIPQSLAAMARPAGTVSYAYQKEEGVYPECQFVYDLEVPESFQPRVGDGEVQEFRLWPLDKVKDAIATEEFKPNCTLVILDFLLRRGHIQPDTEKFYTKFVEKLHSPL